MLPSGLSNEEVRKCHAWLTAGHSQRGRGARPGGVRRCVRRDGEGGAHLQTSMGYSSSVCDRARLVVTEVVGAEEATAAHQRCLPAAPARHALGWDRPQSTNAATAQQGAAASMRSRGWLVEAIATLWPPPHIRSRHVIRATTARHDRAPRTGCPFIATIACAAIGTRSPIGKAQSQRGGQGLGVRPAPPPTGASRRIPTNRARRGAVLAGAGGAIGGAVEERDFSSCARRRAAARWATCQQGPWCRPWGARREGVLGPPRHGQTCGCAALARPRRLGGVGRPVTALRLRGRAGALARLYELHHSGTAMGDARPTLPHHSHRVRPPSASPSHPFLSLSPPRAHPPMPHQVTAATLRTPPTQAPECALP